MPNKRRLGTQDKKFRVLFAEHPQPMWILDSTGQTFLEVNESAAKLYGYAPAEFANIALADIQAPEDARSFLADLQGHARPGASEWRHRTKEGRWIDVEIALHPIRYGGKDAELAVLMDVTSRRQLEEQLHQAQKMEALGLLTGGVAHDFNNLLTIITGYSQLILAKLPEDDPNRQSAEQIVRAAERAGELTSRLLVFSRRRLPRAKIIDLNELVTSLSTMVQRLLGEEIELKLDLAADLGAIHADSSRLEQVILNLAANSRDAMPLGGTLTIATSNTVVKQTGGPVKPGSYVRLTVTDTGTGMDASTQSQVFDPFFTTKAPGSGTGLGLYTVAGIVKQSGGFLELTSQVGQGATFHVYLPRVHRPVSRVAPEIDTDAPMSGGETILLVEDDDGVRSLVREAIESSGYQTLEASGPDEARTVAASYPGEVQLLITDVMMPRASGPELAKELLAHNPNLKVLYISGHSGRTLRQHGVSRKSAAFLAKPFTPAALAAKVREILGRHGKTRNAC